MGRFASLMNCGVWTNKNFQTLYSNVYCKIANCSRLGAFPEGLIMHIVVFTILDYIRYNLYLPKVIIIDTGIVYGIFFSFHHRQ